MNEPKHAGPATSSDPFSEPPVLAAPAGRHIVALDGLRAVAIAQVMLNHFVLTLRPEGGGIALLAASNAFQFLGNGVHLFFVLSGFLITGILIDAKGRDGYFGTFYARRTLRIFPLYYGVLAAVLIGVLVWRAASAAPLPPDAREALGNQWWLWTYLANFAVGLFDVRLDFGVFQFGHFWTLAVEEQFYLVWPIVVLLVDLRWLRRISVAAIVLLLAGRAILTAQGYGAQGGPIFYLLSNDGLFAGAWLAATLRQPSTDPAGRFARARNVFLVAAAAFLVLTAAGFVARAGRLPAGGARALALIQPAYFTVQTAMFTGLVALVVLAGPAGAIGRVLSWPPFVWVGKVSYGLYVYHYLLLVLFAEIARRLASTVSTSPLWLWPTSVALCCGFSVAVAAVSWYAFEQPLLRFKSRFQYGPRRAVDR